MSLLPAASCSVRSGGGVKSKSLASNRRGVQGKTMLFFCSQHTLDQGCLWHVVQFISFIYCDARDRYTSPEANRMNAPRSPHAHRLHDYEAGWLTLLIQMGVATTEQAHEALCRVAQAGIAEREARREARRTRPSKRKKGPEA